MVSLHRYFEIRNNPGFVNRDDLALLSKLSKTNAKLRTDINAFVKELIDKHKLPSLEVPYTTAPAYFAHVGGASVPTFLSWSGEGGSGLQKMRLWIYAHPHPQTLTTDERIVAHFRDAVRRKKLAVVSMFLDEGMPADVDVVPRSNTDDTSTALEDAIAFGNVDMVELLLKHKANPMYTARAVEKWAKMSATYIDTVRVQSAVDRKDRTAYVNSLIDRTARIRALLNTYGELWKKQNHRSPGRRP